ncbi:TetR/AcrR family transcriptional regulator [Sphingobium sp. AM]|nr:TetR/AcrR family transcriptional regulator [Sphingobium sp. AM]
MATSGKAARDAKAPARDGAETKLRKKRRAAFVRAAARIFLKKGYEGTSIDDITRRSGGSKATLYSYFESKERLFEAVMVEELRRRATATFAMLDGARDGDGEADPETVLRAVGTRFINLLLEESSRAFMTISMHEAEKFPNVGRAFHESGPQVVHDHLAALIRRAVERGELHADDPLRAAEQFCLLCQTGLILPFLVRLIDRPGPEQIARSVNAAVDVFMAAYGCGGKRGDRASIATGPATVDGDAAARAPAASGPWAVAGTSSSS